MHSLPLLARGLPVPDGEARRPGGGAAAGIRQAN
jgi:hypothetical protein